MVAAASGSSASLRCLFLSSRPSFDSLSLTEGFPLLIRLLLFVSLYFSLSPIYERLEVLARLKTGQPGEVQPASNRGSFLDIRWLPGIRRSCTVTSVFAVWNKYPGNIVLLVSGEFLATSSRGRGVVTSRFTGIPKVSCPVGHVQSSIEVSSQASSVYEAFHSVPMVFSESMMDCFYY